MVATSGYMPVFISNTNACPLCDSRVFVLFTEKFAHFRVMQGDEINNLRSPFEHNSSAEDSKHLRRERQSKMNSSIVV